MLSHKLPAKIYPSLPPCYQVNVRLLLAVPQLISPVDEISMKASRAWLARSHLIYNLIYLYIQQNLSEKISTAG